MKKREEQVVVQTMKAGFTLVELLVVVAILGILGTIAVQNVIGNIGKARQTAAEQGVQSLHEACTTYYIQHKKLWDNKYEMETKGKKIIIKSAGEDGVMGTEDDVRSDAKKKKN